jgi:peptidoglycan/LPS O-acetylase OafA/YrhL
VFGSPVAFWWFTSTWSLAIEEQFSLVSPHGPLLVKTLTTFLIIVIAGAPTLRLVARNYWDSGPWLAYRLMPCQADALAIGMLMAVLWNNSKFRGWLATRGALMYGLLEFYLPVSQ